MITSEYRKILADIHKQTPFGKRSKIPTYLKKFIKKYQPKSILDFGCGKGNLVKTLSEDYPNINVQGYDPANESFNNLPEQVDMIVSTDVLEHIEPEFIDDTIKLLAKTSKLHYHLISCAPAKLILPDGRNAHLIQESPDWWKHKFVNAGFRIIDEDYKEFYKYSKQLKKDLLVKNFFVMMEINYGFGTGRGNNI